MLFVSLCTAYRHYRRWYIYIIWASGLSILKFVQQAVYVAQWSVGKRTSGDIKLRNDLDLHKFYVVNTNLFQKFWIRGFDVDIFFF